VEENGSGGAWEGAGRVFGVQGVMAWRGHLEVISRVEFGMFGMDAANLIAQAKKYGYDD
jgi:hypothetical protein